MFSLPHLPHLSETPLVCVLRPSKNGSQRPLFPKFPKGSKACKNPQNRSWENASKNSHQIWSFWDSFSIYHNFWSTEAFLMRLKYVIGHILKLSWPHRHPQYVHPKAQNSKIWKIFEIFFWKTKSDKMCHMRACMGWPFRDVKALYLANLLRQKKFRKFWKKFYDEFFEEILDFWNKKGFWDPFLESRRTQTRGVSDKCDQWGR